MKFSINIEIELSDEEISFLKKRFLPNRGTIWHFAISSLNESTALKTLTEKGVIVIESIANSTLTDIGHKILDSFDRDKKISDLLDGTNELNLDNPIFVVYLNVDNLPTPRAQELIEQYRRNLKYDNVTFWIVAVENQKTKIELLWKGQKYDNSSQDEQLPKRLTKLIDLMSEGLTDEIVKQKLRDYLLNDLLDDKI